MASCGWIRLLGLLLLAVLAFPNSEAIKFPNDIDGQPEIECGDQTVTISVKTTNGVASRIYAKGHFVDSDCTFEKTNNGTFSIGTCGMNRQRQLEPRGVSYGLVVVVQLHPMFVTKVDRAYSIRCFYMETEKTVTSLLDVSMISTQTVTGGAPMPVCNYELHADSPNGPTVRYARVGDKVWHTWTCPSPNYGMLVHSCVVTDGQGNDFRVIDGKGCSIDPYVIRTPDYSTDLTRVQQETHVFKFADRTAVLFNCQIKLCQKADGGCEGTSPPICGGNVSSTPSSGGQSEQIVSEPPDNTTTTTSSGSSTVNSTLNQTRVSDVEVTTAASTSSSTQSVTSTAASTSPSLQSTTTSGGVEANATELVRSTNQTSVLITFPTPDGFPPNGTDTPTTDLINSTRSIEVENVTIIEATQTPAFTLPILSDNSTEFETVSNNTAEVTTGIVETSTASSSTSQVTGTSENSTITEEATTQSTVVSSSPFFRENEFSNTTSTTPESRNLSSSIIGEDGIAFALYHNMTTSEGFMVFSKSGHKNLSSSREFEDGVTEVASSGDGGSGFGEFGGGESGNSNDTFDDALYHQNRTRTTVSPLTLANATIIVVGGGASGDDGRGRRNVLSPLVDATSQLIKREDEDRLTVSNSNNDGRRLKDQPVVERLPDIETDVSQLMWVLEPEEGGVQDEQSGGNESAYRSRANDPVRALNDEQRVNELEDNDEWRRATITRPGRVCLSPKTMLAIVMPLVAMVLFTVAVVVFCLRRLRSQKLMPTSNANYHPHHHHQQQHSLPLNYLYKRS